MGALSEKEQLTPPPLNLTSTLSLSISVNLCSPPYLHPLRFLVVLFYLLWDGRGGYPLVAFHAFVSFGVFGCGGG